jgi:hypothetical protein
MSDNNVIPLISDASIKEGVNIVLNDGRKIATAMMLLLTENKARQEKKDSTPEYITVLGHIGGIAQLLWVFKEVAYRAGMTHQEYKDLVTIFIDEGENLTEADVTPFEAVLRKLIDEH